MPEDFLAHITRSVLFAPGNHERRIASALRSGADVVVLDLEDGVPASEKSVARALVATALKRQRTCRAYVRINALRSKYWERDLEAVVSATLDGLVLPKAENAAELRQLDAYLQVLESRVGLESGSLDLMPIIESARGIWDCESLTGASPRIRRLIFGGADYTLDLDLDWTAEEHELSFARARLAHASRVAGIEAPIDTAILQVRDAQRFASSASNGRRMGFQGKLCLHPAQLDACHAIFSPSHKEIEHARSIVAAFDTAQSRGSAAIELDGLFIDTPVVLRARRVLAIAAQHQEQHR